MMKNPVVFEIYKDKRKEWRWRALRFGIGKKSKIIADSGEGYKTKSGCDRAIGALVRAVSGGNFETK